MTLTLSARPHGTPRLTSGTTLRLAPVAADRWRVVDSSGRIIGHLDALVRPGGSRYRARRYHAASRAFLRLVEGALVAMPLRLGLRGATVIQSRVTARALDLDLDLPRDRSLLERARRMVRGVRNDDPLVVLRRERMALATMTRTLERERDELRTVLECLPDERQDELLYRIANLSEVSSEVIAELEQLIDRSLQVLSAQGSQVRGIKQAADIMNRFKGDRNQMFELLRGHSEDLVERIEEEMYDFFILSRQSQDTLQALLEAIPLEEWVVALKGAEPALVKAIQGAMPKRQAQQMDAIKRRQGPVPLSRVEQVRRDIMAMVRELAAEGEIQLQLFREQTVE